MKNLASKIELILGRAYGTPQAQAGAGMGLRVDLDAFQEIVSHWRSLPAERRPHLRAILPSSSESSRHYLNYVFEVPEEPRLFLLGVDVPLDRVLPSVASVWPYARWWQEELGVFTGVRYEGARAREELPWQV